MPNEKGLARRPVAWVCSAYSAFYYVHLANDHPTIYCAVFGQLGDSFHTTIAMERLTPPPNFETASSKVANVRSVHLVFSLHLLM